MKAIFLIVLLLVSVSAGWAQPDTLWTRIYGGNNREWGNSVQQTSDGGFIIAGITLSYGNGFQVYLIKTDTAGNLQWQNNYGGLGTDQGYSVRQTFDGGYIIAGRTNSFGAGNFDAYLIKTDAAGNEEWSRAYGEYAYEDAKCVTQTYDGGYIIVGIRDSYGMNCYDVYLIKVDYFGNEQWNRSYGDNHNDYGEYVQQTMDGGYIITGYTWSHNDGNYNALLIRTNENGNRLFHNSYGIFNTNERGQCVQQTNDGGFVIVGGSYMNGFEGNIYLTKTDAEGFQEWTQIIGGDSWECGYGIRQTFDGGYIIAGGTELGPFNQDVYVIKTDIYGFEQWSKVIGGDESDLSYSIALTDDGGYITVGETYSYSIGWNDVYLIRLDAEGTLVESFSQNLPSDFALHPPSPNPFNSSTAITFTLNQVAEIKLSVYDVLGREIAALGTGHWASGKHQVVWEADGVGSGVYFVRLIVDGRWSMVEKVALMK